MSAIEIAVRMPQPIRRWILYGYVAPDLRRLAYPSLRVFIFGEKAVRP